MPRDNCVRYSKEMREQATRKKLSLITLDVPGITYQVSGTEEQVREVRELLQTWIVRAGESAINSSGT